MAEAKAIYEDMEKGFVKGRLDSYRAMLKDLRDALKDTESSAGKWAKAKDPEAAFAKWNKGYAEDNKELMKAYRELTEKESRGGNVQVLLGGFMTSWEAFNGDLGGNISSNEKFAPALTELRKQLDTIETELDAIEKDESVEADPPPEGKGKKAKKK